MIYLCIVFFIRPRVNILLVFCLIWSWKNNMIYFFWKAIIIVRYDGNMLKSQPLKGWGWRVSSLKSTSNYMARSYLKNWWKYWGRAEKLEIVDFACTSHAQTENFFPWPRSGLAQPILLSAYQSLRPVRLISIHSETEKQSKPRGQRLICLVLSRRK